MSWFADLAGKAESLLNNLDEQTGAVLRNSNGVKQTRHDKIVNGDSTEGQKKRLNIRNMKKNASLIETKSNNGPTVQSLPSKSPPLRSPNKQSIGNNIQDTIRKKPVVKKTLQHNLNSPKSSGGDFNGNEVDQFGLRHRRYSLPSDLEMINSEKLTYKMQNLEVENAMLKNELNVMNREVSNLLDRLRKTEDELKSAQIKFENSDKLTKMLKEENESLLVKLNEECSSQKNIKEQKSQSESSIHLLEYKNSELEDKIKLLTEELNNMSVAHNKLEKELRHAQNIISEQQSNLEKTKEECHRLEKDWEAYKLRVKNMLYAKDNEIKSLREGANLTEDTKALIEQIDTLKEEKEDLSQSIAAVRKECLDLKLGMSQLEQRHSAAERFVSALRDTLNEERSARNRAEAQCLALGKELQTLRMVSAETISSLRTALQSKEEELNNLKEIASTTNTSALNVAEYDESRDTESDKIYHLSDLLIEKQNKIDSLIADKNMLKIQLDKLEVKYKAEIATLNAKKSDSVVHLQDVNSRLRTNHSRTPFSLHSLLNFKFGRFPMLRIFIFLYMISLHIYVLAVLYTRMPDDYAPRPTKS